MSTTSVSSSSNPSPAEPLLSPQLEAAYGEQLRAQQAMYIAALEEKVAAAEQQQEENARLRANRSNARFSTGPRTVAGKEISRLNAIRHGLTGREVLLANEDAEAYSIHVEQFRADWTPATPRETELVQTLADTQWRLNRIPGLEGMVYAFGRVEYADLYADADPAYRAKLIDFHIYKAEAKELRNLALQENRLRRFYENAEIELEDLQSARQEREQIKARIAAAEQAMNAVPSEPPAPVEPQPDQRVRFSETPRRSFVYKTKSDTNAKSSPESKPNQPLNAYINEILFS